MNNLLVFDIETIPQLSLSPTQINKVNEKTENSEYWKINPIKEMSLNPWFGRIICIGVGFPETNEYDALAAESELEILLKFWKIIDGFKGTFISFNGLGFDVPFITTRSLVHNLMPTNSNFLNTRRYQSFPHFDVAQHISDWDSRLRVSLDIVCDSLGIKSPKDGDTKADSVYASYLDGKLKDIETYCKKDLVATYEVYERLRRFRTT